MLIHRSLIAVRPILCGRLCAAAMEPSTGNARYSNGGRGGELGSGVGRGGGGGGSVREAGGAFGRMEVAREEEYFRRLQKQQVKDLRDEVEREVRYHEQQIKHHKDAMERMVKRKTELQKEQDNL